MKKILLIYLFFILFSGTGFAQMKIVLLGSSTTAGAASSSSDSSYAGRLQAYVRRNTNASDPDTIVYIVAQYGYTTDFEMPTGDPAKVQRGNPDPNYNVTKALSYSPDIIIINLPSNDVKAYDFPGSNPAYTKSETMDNFREMARVIRASGVKCFVTTTQPRNDMTDQQRQDQHDLADSIKKTFGIFSINFWDTLVVKDGSNKLRDDVRHIGYSDSEYHLTNTGHRFIFKKLLDANIFLVNSPLPIILKDFSAGLNSGKVILTWHTESEEANTYFEIERSANGRDFEIIGSIKATGNGLPGSYLFSDQVPLQGTGFYRLKINELNKLSYSRILNVRNSPRPVVIGKVYVSPTLLTAQVSSEKNQQAEISIINIAGLIILKQPFAVGLAREIQLQVGFFSSGEYILKISTADGNSDFKKFLKIN